MLLSLYMNLLSSVYEKIFGSTHQRVISDIQPIVDSINALESAYGLLSNEALALKTQEFRNRLQNGETLDALLPEAFATVREASKRVLGMRHYDVQLIGGIALHRGMIAEMRTGEGKTLVATLPTYLNALDSRGVHVITVNDYLAKRDAVWMGPIYAFLGLSVGIIQQQRVTYLYDQGYHPVSADTASVDVALVDEQKSYKVEEEYLRRCARQDAYRADITYGTNNEFGFDYLRDNMVQQESEMVMRPGSEMHYAIIDEIDSILIDEARTPLIISAPAGEATDHYYTFATIVKQLQEGVHYNLDEKLRSATLTAEGISFVEQSLGIENMYAEGGMQMVHHIEQALKAQVLFLRDKEYVLEGGQVVIVDEFTGRKMAGRRYSEGLHQAIEAKEGVAIQQESRTLATITFQNLFRMYRKLSGMTGTAITEEEEFRTIYGLDVLVIPTNKGDARLDHNDRIYKTEAGKYQAILSQIQACQQKQQPILIGTISVEKNERLSAFLTQKGISHELLNAKNHEREGEIIAQAGRPGAVTLATNMAGRGVDIKLGGADAEDEQKQRVLESGGLFVLGTERHESRRIDNQLRGRSARQGDVGETLFLVSTEDDLMRIFAGERLKSVMNTLKVPDDMPIEQSMITRMLETAQKKVESHNYDIRKHLLSYDDILNKQRQVIYKKRREILGIDRQQEESITNDQQSKGTKGFIVEFIEQEIEFIVSYHTNDVNTAGAGWNTKEIIDTVNTIFPLSVEDKQHIEELAKQGGQKFDDVQSRDALVQFLLSRAHVAYNNIEIQVQQSAATLGEPEKAATIMQDIERQVLLRTIDMLWVDHLVQMDYLRTGIGLRGYGQRDPLIEYKRESFGLFNQLLQQIQKEVVYSFFKVGIGIDMAPSVMSDAAVVLQGAQKTSADTSESVRGTASRSSEPKQKMSKKERRRLRQGERAS